MKNFIKKLFYIEDIPGVPFGKIHLFGFKIKWYPDQTFISDIISKQVAREVYSALDVQMVHNKTFPKFKNINKNKNVLIYGTGPTLKFYNQEVQGEQIALNKAILIDSIDFQYSFCIDESIRETCPDYIDIITNKAKQGCKCFLGKHLHPERSQLPELALDENDNIFRFYSAARHSMPAKSYDELIFPNIENHPLVDFRSVAFPALQFALYTHPKKIYLIGLDTSNNGNIFDKKSGYSLKEMLKGYKKLKKYIMVHYPDVEIISINPIGLKGFFKDVYTQSFVDSHPELKNTENIIII